MRSLQKIGSLKGDNEDQQAGINIGLRALNILLKLLPQMLEKKHQ